MKDTIKEPLPDDDIGHEEPPEMITTVKEIENGIFNLVITLCQQKTFQMDIKQAKQEVSDWLNRLATGLTNT